MKINYAVDRLYETGWLPTEGAQLERLPNGLRYPVMAEVRQVFDDAGLELLITPHLMFGCYRGEWRPRNSTGELAGTVIGSCEAEAAVYALAKLREQQFELQASANEAQLAAV